MIADLAPPRHQPDDPRHRGIGVIGLLSDLLFKWANQRLWPWAF